MKKLFSIVLMSIVLYSCNKGKNNETACNGNTRRDIKILIDDKSNAINFSPITTTIDSLQLLQVEEPKSETPRMSVEYQAYTLIATVEKVKKEHDGDYHLRLTDGTNYLIAEIPNPDCEYLENSTNKELFRSLTNFVKDGDLEGKTIKITGIAFVDIDHHYKRKQAKNNIELHPVLSIEF